MRDSYSNKNRTIHPKNHSEYYFGNYEDNNSTNISNLNYYNLSFNKTGLNISVSLYNKTQDFDGVSKYFSKHRSYVLRESKKLD